MDHYNNPRNVGSFDNNDPDVGTGLVGAPACGDVMKLQIRVDDKTGKIVDARFKTFGCGSAIASSSVGMFFIFLFFFFEFDNLGVNFSILTGLGLNFLGLLFNLLDQFACLVFGEALYSIVYVLVTALI